VGVSAIDGAQKQHQQQQKERHAGCVRTAVVVEKNAGHLNLFHLFGFTRFSARTTGYEVGKTISNHGIHLFRPFNRVYVFVYTVVQVQRFCWHDETASLRGGAIAL